MKVLMLMMTFSPMSTRPSIVAEPICGSSTTLPARASLTSFRVHRRLVLEHVEAGAGDVAGFDQPRQRVLVDHLAARGVDDEGFRPQHLQPPRRQQVKGRRRVRAIDRHDVHAGEHLVEALPIGRVELLLDLRRHPAAVVIVDLQAEGARARRATAWPIRPMPMMPRRLPQMRWPSIQVGDQPAQSLSAVSTVEPSTSRRGTARISAMVMSAVSSVSTPGVLVTVMPRWTAVATSILSTPLPKLAISLSCSPGLVEHRGVDPVGHGRHQHVGGFHRLGQLGLGHRLVVEVEPGVEQFAHARLDAVGQLARDDDQRLSWSSALLPSGFWRAPRQNAGLPADSGPLTVLGRHCVPVPGGVRSRPVSLAP